MNRNRLLFALVVLAVAFFAWKTYYKGPAKGAPGPSALTVPGASPGLSTNSAPAPKGTPAPSSPSSVTPPGTPGAPAGGQPGSSPNSPAPPGYKAQKAPKRLPAQVMAAYSQAAALHNNAALDFSQSLAKCRSAGDDASKLSSCVSSAWTPMQTAIQKLEAAGNPALARTGCHDALVSSAKSLTQEKQAMQKLVDAAKQGDLAGAVSAGPAVRAAFASWRKADNEVVSRCQSR